MFNLGRKQQKKDVLLKMLLVLLCEFELGRAFLVEVNEEEGANGVLHELIRLSLRLQCPLEEFQGRSHEDDMSDVVVLDGFGVEADEVFAGEVLIELLLSVLSLIVAEVVEGGEEVEGKGGVDGEDVLSECLEEQVEVFQALNGGIVLEL